ncbi:hypothetical protein Y032_0034g2816 [Ancylostoma ceylanicum]|nr:hypothetical protein Y032_0034g2816 [Ancylostoma ceylanicum]
MKVVIFLLLTSSCHGFLPRHLQSVGVQGKLRCNGKPLDRAGLQLHESGGYAKDYLMSSTIPDKTGSFKFFGTTEAVFMMRPVLRIFHRCNYKGTCPARAELRVPKNYVVEGLADKIVKFYDFGVLDLINTKSTPNCAFDYP